MDKERIVMYLCNREKPCKEYCRDLGHCKHTSDILYAKNFHRVEGATDREIYEEDDEHCIASVIFNPEDLEKIVDERVIEPIKNGELVIKDEKRAEGLREQAEELRDIGDSMSNPKQPYNEPVKACRDLAKEQEQLAEWLKELKRLRSENEVILRRLKHLLESKYISEFDKVDPVTKEYIKDIRSADRSVMYLCNREKPCKEHCRDLGHCKHTSDILYAKNFHRVEGATDREIYEEDDEHCIASVIFNPEDLEKIVDERIIEPIKNGELVIKDERPHGEWEELKTNPPEFLGHRFYICSQCGREIDVMTPDESLDDYPYCHCGACMMKKETEND